MPGRLEGKSAFITASFGHIVHGETRLIDRLLLEVADLARRWRPYRSLASSLLLAAGRAPEPELTSSIDGFYRCGA